MWPALSVPAYEGRLDCTHASAEPPGQAAKEEADGAKQCGA
jgi:hypothetical protein